MRPARLRSAPIVVGIIALALFCVGVMVPPWVIPPIQSIETGPAALEMVQFKDSRPLPYSEKPEPLEPADNTGSPKASTVYQNVQVLGDLTDAEFTRLMLAMTSWVAPKQGCEYCHNLNSDAGFADDSLYTKKVARRMLQMVRYINSHWAQHVAPSGVTCYTCHRGQNVPPWTWYEQKKPSGDHFLGKPRPWHLEAKTIRQFFPDVPYNEYLMEDHKSAQIQSEDPLVSFRGKAEVAKEQDAEDLYLLMMQMAQSMGVNCTFCHSSRAFFDWSQSTPYRWIAFWGIRMARDLNTNYIEPLKTVFPAKRKGPLGDPAKIACGTCHEGNNKPLGGYRLLDHYLAGLTEDGKAPDPAPKQAILLGKAIPVAVSGSDQKPQPAPMPAPVSKKAIEQSVAPAGSSQGAKTPPGVAVPGGGQSGQSGADYKSQANPPQTIGSPNLGGTVTPVPQEKNVSPPAPEPTGTQAPMNSKPQYLAPGTPMEPKQEMGTANAPDTGLPPSTQLPADKTQGKKTPEEQEKSPEAAPLHPQAPSGANNPAAEPLAKTRVEPAGANPAPQANGTAPSATGAGTGGSQGNSAAPAPGVAVPKPDGQAPAGGSAPGKGPAQGTTTRYQ
ncbi:photosynthetic reaction center cytochrome PufC [Jiella sp. M17.18]|uniref:photosynthetic reaction center cytochrome PufC n=1 Tax=Jiella sp. M17.18 TaxID=3234247 RepID=UPI0034DE4D1C